MIAGAVLGQELAEYCEGELFNATCPDGFAVLITKAVYGRMRRSRCVVVRQDFGCSTDVLVHLDWRCSGRPSCRLPVTDLLQVGTKPCPMDYRSYLEASYDCVPGQLASQELNRLVTSLDHPNTIADLFKRLAQFYRNRFNERYMNILH